MVIRDGNDADACGGWRLGTRIRAAPSITSIFPQLLDPSSSPGAARNKSPSPDNRWITL